MNRRDEQIAAIARRSENLDPARLAEFVGLVREAYRSSSIVDRVAQVEESNDRTPSDFRVLTNQELRRIDQFNGPNYSWTHYCAQLGRSVALAEKAYIAEVLDRDVEPTPTAPVPGLRGLADAVEGLVERGYSPGAVFAPVEYMPALFAERSISLDWDRSGQPYLLVGDTRLAVFWSSRDRLVDRFVVVDPVSGLWRVKLDPRGGGRLTVAIGEQMTPVHGVVWLAETVVKFEVVDAQGCASFTPDPEWAAAVREDS